MRRKILHHDFEGGKKKGLKLTIPLMCVKQTTNLYQICSYRHQEFRAVFRGCSINMCQCPLSLLLRAFLVWQTQFAYKINHLSGERQVFRLIAVSNQVINYYSPIKAQNYKTSLQQQWLWQCGNFEIRKNNLNESYLLKRGTCDVFKINSTMDSIGCRVV